jgi:predicted aldo/keto reductase-like oxidoreductase
LGAHTALSQAATLPVPHISHPSGMPRRVLGRTGEQISVVGFPGLALSHHDQEGCDKGVRNAFEQGVNYYDVAPAYGRDGECEIKLGISLQKLGRDKVFLACKTKARDAQGAREELERSLKRLKTDHFDLYQLHHLWDPKDVEKALGPDGAMETVLKAKEEGKIRHIGFSAHTTKAALQVMKGFRFDTVMFPINFVEYYSIGFGREVIELANEQGVAVLAIKPTSRGRWPEGMEQTRKWWYRSMETQPEIDMALRWTLSQPGVVAGVPISFLDVFDRVIVAGKTYQPISIPETTELQSLAANSLSVFKREEDRVASAGPYAPIYPDSPYEDCPPCMHA